MKAVGYAKSVIGGREGNQDAFLVLNDRGLYAVADGVGGGLRGEVASQMSVEGLKSHPDSTDLKSTFLKIQDSVLAEAMASIGEALMGSTLTAFLVKEGVGYLCHVGDSRCYRLSEGELRCHTVDHEIQDEALGGPVLASYMGIPAEVHPITIQEETIPLKVGDQLILCSDGLYKQVGESRLVQLLGEHADAPDRLLDVLCNEAAAVPHSDNVTVVYIQIRE